jgi:acetyl-CoA hydrolase
MAAGHLAPARAAERLDPARLELARWIRPTDTVAVGQGCGEPLALTRALVAQRHAYAGARVRTATVMSDTFRPEHADALRFASTGITAGNRALAAAGAIDVVPAHYGEIDRLYADGELDADVVLVQVSPPDAEGRVTLGAAHDALVSAIPRARVAIAEVNARAPRVRADVDFRLEDFDAFVEVDAALAESRPAPGGEVAARIGDAVAALVPERATLQLGIGAVPDAVLARLADRRGLGFHSGMMSDAVVALIECGAIDDAHKGIDPGCAVTGLLLGTERLFRFAHENPRVAVRRPSYTHGARVHAQVRRLFSINTAIEVDLSGQVNAEALGGRPLGMIGGQVEFVRGTRLSEGGRSVIALASTAGAARASRIVAALDGPVTTPRSDVDCVVTEWGVAALRGRSLAERARALVAIADPAHREALDRAAFAQARARGAGGG